MFQIVFNEISVAEISRLDALAQMEFLDDFKISEQDFETLDDEKFGKIERDGKTLHRFRSKEWRVYFETGEDSIVIHRILHRNSLKDFFFRSNLGSGKKEDEVLAKSKHFWKLIDEGRNAKRA